MLFFHELATLMEFVKIKLKSHESFCAPKKGLSPHQQELSQATEKLAGVVEAKHHAQLAPVGKPIHLINKLLNQGCK